MGNRKIVQEYRTDFSRYYEGIDGVALGFATLWHENVEIAKDSYLVDGAEGMLGMDGEQLVEHHWQKYSGDVQGVDSTSSPSSPNPASRSSETARTTRTVSDGLPSRLEDHEQGLVTQDKKPVAPSNSDRSRGITSPFPRYRNRRNNSAERRPSASPKAASPSASIWTTGAWPTSSPTRRSESFDLKDLVRKWGCTSSQKNTVNLPEQQAFIITEQQKPVSEQGFDGGQSDISPDQTRQTIRAHVESDSHDVERAVLRLYQGSDEGQTFPSETDRAMMKRPYYWCREDQQLIDGRFGDFGRMRRK